MAKKESKALNKKEKNSKDKKSFFKSFKGELKKVSWPTPKQLVNNTIAVIVIVVVIAVIVFVLDLAFDAVNKYGIDKIKEAVVSTSDETENTEAPENTEIDENAENTEATEETSTDETTEVNE
ncbi:MAG: preprotein translocase subunit SecE [Clostridia bacterium]|nr:preprotein translocase subunit SecE [Clostridia bacterium]